MSLTVSTSTLTTDRSSHSELSGSPKAASRHIRWSPDFRPNGSIALSPRSQEERFRPISPCTFGYSLVSFDRYIVDLFKAALGEDIKEVNNLLRHPLFKDRIFEVLTESKTKTSRINILRHLAHYHINSLEKQEVEELIQAVGVSTYVRSADSKNIQNLYKGLFSYQKKEPALPHNSLPQSFSKAELLEFEAQANLNLRPHILIAVLKNRVFKQARASEVFSLVSKLEKTAPSIDFKNKFFTAFFAHRSITAISIKSVSLEEFRPLPVEYKVSLLDRIILRDSPVIPTDLIMSDSGPAVFPSYPFWETS